MSGPVTPGALVLVDTNAIVEAHRTRTWAALVGAYHVETVEDCVTETQTGYQSRDRDQWIDVPELRASLRAVHEVSDRERAELAVRASDIALDRGEESLWAHALGRTDLWFLCGPDRASLRVGVRLELRGRLASLEELLIRVGHHSHSPTTVHSSLDGSRFERNGGGGGREAAREPTAAELTTEGGTQRDGDTS